MPRNVANAALIPSPRRNDRANPIGRGMGAFLSLVVLATTLVAQPQTPAAAAPPKPRTVQAAARKPTLPPGVSRLRFEAPAALPADAPSPPTENVKPTFVWASIGDSYGSGEGNPATSSSQPASVIWGDGSYGTPQALRGCHRSDNAGAPLAHRDLVDSYGDQIDLAFTHVACSGARINGILNPVSDAGPDRFVSVDEPAQLAQLAEFTDTEGSLDAVSVSIGGNDGGFGNIVVTCLLSGCGEADTASFQPRWDGLAARYDSLQPELEAITPNVLISKYPDFSQDTDGSTCTAGDNFPDLTQLVSQDEADWASGVALQAINGQIDAAAGRHGWTVVDDHLAAWAGHGICSDVPFTHNNNSARAVQGADFEINQPVGQVAADLLVGVSSGLAHPNAAGYRAYRDAIATEIEPLVRAKIHQGLVQPTNVRIASAEAGGPIVVRWQDRSTTETRYEVRATSIEAFPSVDGPTTHTVTGVSEYSHDIAASAVVDYRVRACNDVGCTPWTDSVRGSNRHPRVVNELEAFRAARLQGGDQVVVDWATDRAVSDWIVRRHQTGPAAPSQLLNRGRIDRYAFPVPVTGGAVYTFDVAGCNRVGCSAFRSVSLNAQGLRARVIDTPSEAVLEPRRVNERAPRPGGGGPDGLTRPGVRGGRNR